MAEILVTAVTEALISKLISIASDEIYMVWGVKDEMTKLQATLLTIQAVLSDAEKQQLEKDAVTIWLATLKDAVYDAEDMLDEFAYEALRHHGSVRNKVKNFFSLSNPISFRFKMGHKLKDVNKTLDCIARGKDKFQFNIACSNSTIISANGPKNRETHSLVDDTIIVGREHEKSKIINWLINSSDNHQKIYSIVRIVGMGGVGKTTLAQIIYGDVLVTNHFDRKIWVCVSQNSNQKEVLGKLLELILEKKDDFSSLELIVNKLKECIRGKKFLIVLDDMWNDNNNEWDDMFRTLMLICSLGSKLMVTTRSDDIASTLSSSIIHRLEGLPEEKCWSLFEKTAFQPGGIEKTLELIKIGKNISKKCGGVPLAAKIIGSLMSKTDGVEWQAIADNDIWDLHEGEEKVIRVLKLSYDHLEPHLKQCFSYCSLFPKDHIIKKDNLIRLWMAEGFLSHARGSKRMEKVGNEYFSILLTNSFFQEEQKNGLGGIKSCKMHALLHDLAQSVARTEYCSMVDVSKRNEMETRRLRRVCFSFEKEFSRIPETMYQLKKLRTFISSTPKFINKSCAMQIFTNFSCLRVLDLRDSAITDLPSSVAKLQHMRYLNLSNSQVTSLSDSFSSLYNLQTLVLKNCFKLKDLPRGMSKLSSMRHLIICKTRTNEWIPPMPSKLRNLSCLHYLPLFIVGNKNNGFGIEELRDLNLLGGKLQIHNLENVIDRKDAEGGHLKEKQEILRLELHWMARMGSESCGDVDNLEVLEGLQPHQNLKRLGIHNYAGSQFPTWMMSSSNLLPNLVNVVLKYCSRCQHLPTFGQLPFLKFLQIEGLDTVKCIGSEFYGSNSSNVFSFPSLEDLSIFRMVNLVEWSDHISSSSSSSSPSSFPRLQRLKVKFCPKLTTMPTRFSSLKVLEFIVCNGKAVRSLVECNLTSLTSVSIEKCDELVFLPQGLLKGNNILQKLGVNNCRNFEGFNSAQSLEDEEEEHIQLPPNSSVHTLMLLGCPSLVSWPSIHGFNSLSFLVIKGCKRQKSILSGIESLPKLEYLAIGPFSEELDSYPFPAASIEQEASAGDYFPSLCSLQIDGWSKVNSLPVQIQYISSLKDLYILDFPSLEALPEWLGNLTSLRELRIGGCKNLNHMPSLEQMLCLTSLQQLKIINCPLLAARCKQEGEESNKLFHIPNVHIVEDYNDIKSHI